MKYSNNERLISIIVPVYNVEKYLSATINSILEQTYYNWELLLIDDGSTDRSGDICDEFSNIDSRIRTFHIENGGVSRARNFGIDNSKGDLIVFCDSDDMIAPHMLSTLYKLQIKHDADIVHCGCLDIEEYLLNFTSTESVTTTNIFEGDNLINVSPVFFYVVWGKLYRMSLIKDNNLRFNEYMNRGEDTLFAYQTILCCGRVVQTNKKLVNYRIRKDSLMRSPPTASLFLQNHEKYYKLMSFISDKHISNTLAIVLQNNAYVDMVEALAQSAFEKDQFDKNLALFFSNSCKGIKLFGNFPVRKRLRIVLMIIPLAKKKIFVSIVREIIKKII